MVKFSFIEQHLLILWANITFQGVTSIYKLIHEYCKICEKIVLTLNEHFELNN